MAESIKKLSFIKINTISHSHRIYISAETCFSLDVYLTSVVVAYNTDTNSDCMAY